MKETTERSDRQELESLRVSLARIAQALSVQSIILPVLVKSEFGELCKLAREQNRGWNSLSAAIMGRLETMALNNLYSVRALAMLALDYLKDDKRTLKDVENLLTSFSAIIPPGARDIYTRAVSAISQQGDAYTYTRVQLDRLLHWSEDSLKRMGGLIG